MSHHMLFHDIDEPGLNTLEVYKRRGGYEMLRKALSLAPQQITDELLASNVRGRGGAGFAMGPQGALHAGGTRWTSTSCATPTRASPGRSRTAS